MYPFDPNEAQESGGQWRLPLTVGDVVVLKEETDDWYLGHLLHNPGLVGIFPKSYVSSLLWEIRTIPPIVHEISSALREWNNHFKVKFLEGDVDNVMVVKALMREVMAMRSSLLSGKMTLEETREMQEKVTNKMDFLNHSLELDLVVRDESGTVLSPEGSSAVALYRHHVEGSEKIKNMMLPRPRGDGETSNFFKIMMTVKNFVSSKVVEDVDLIISIYEVSSEASKTPKPLCENYIVHNWRRNPYDPSDIERRNNLKVLFADISKNDVTGKRLFLICNVISEGNFNSKGSQFHYHQQQPESASKSASRIDLSVRGGTTRDGVFRKPIGVAAVEITDLFTFKQGKTTSELGRENEVSAPFLAGSDNEPFESVFRKLVFEKKGHDSKSLWVTLNVMMGDLSDQGMSSSNDTHRHHSSLLSGVNSRLMPVARKIGLPEVILPSDYRNDLYVMLVGGEFSRLDRRTDRNVEVSVEVCDEGGLVIENAVSGGEGVEPEDVFRSVVFHHESRPRWNEMTKVTIPVDRFTGSHLRFSFRHRSSNVTKEKSPPWAMAFLRLVNDHDKTAVRDGTHELLVYKIEKKFEFEGAPYLQLPCPKSNLYHLKQKSSLNLTALPKDSFVVQTTLCSTKLTQNEGLLSLLKWRDDPAKLSENLNIFSQKVNGKEFVKSLPDVLDALFSILTEACDTAEYDYKVFKSLINVIHLITEDSRYQQFVPVLDMYIQKNFSATLAYNKLLLVLKECVEGAYLRPMDLTQAMKSLKYIFRLVVQSRSLFVTLHGNKGHEPFQQMLGEVLHSLVELMFYTTHDLYQGQAFCLKHMVQSVPDLETVFDRRQLAEIIVKMVQSLPKNQLPKEKLLTLKDLVHSGLFHYQDCRSVMMPELASRIRDVLEDKEEDSDASPLVSTCTQTLGDILDSLHRFERDRPGSTLEDVSVLMSTTLRTVIKSVANRKRKDPGAQATVANMVGLFRVMSARHYDQYIDGFHVETPAGRSDLVDFIMEVLGMFTDLVQNDVFSSDWMTMMLLQNSVLLQTLRHLSNTIRDFLKEPFEYQAWSNFFQCAVTFVTQPSLQMERFSENKRERVQSLYKDMRKEMAMVVKSMWFNLGQQKIRFVPEMVGPFLEMTLIPETELRKATIPIFFDMMQCEYYSSKYRTENGDVMMCDTRRDISMSKGNFKDFEREMIVKLDTMIEAGRGDEHYKALFRQIMMSHCSSHTALNKSGESLVDLVTRLMEFLLEYRTIASEEGVENQVLLLVTSSTTVISMRRDNFTVLTLQMSCIVNLFDFYQSIRYEELYLKYLKKLCSLHEMCGNWSEAACTLLQYAELLLWTERPLRNTWERHRGCRTHRSLKEQLYLDAIRNFEKGKMWERALRLCKELVTQYEEETYEYAKLEGMHQKIAGFYNSIMNELRPDPEYFRVAFYGRGFPAFLQNKVFVYRGKGFERLPEFQGRILDQFPNAELMKTLKAPDEEEKERPVQLLQINKLDPVMGEAKFRGKFVNQQIISYYKANEVREFTYSRPFTKKKDSENEFASLWVERTVLRTKYTFPGVLQWFSLAVPEESFELCPLDNAVETMQRVNEELRWLILEHADGANPPLNPLSMKLNGIIDAAVMGGTARYEKAFFSESYVHENPEHGDSIRVLKNLIAEQVPLLDVGLRIHEYKKTDDLRQLHNKMESMFGALRREVEEKYGRRPCDISVKKVSSGGGGSGHRKSSGGGGMEVRRSNFSGSSDHSKLVTASTGDLSRASLATQNSLEATAVTPRSRMLSAIGIGITRKKSNAEAAVSSSNRSSLTRSQNSASAILENGFVGGHGLPQDSDSPASFVSYTGSSPSVVVTQTPICRLPITTTATRSNSSRPSSGQYMIGTPTTSIGVSGVSGHSRSPSIASSNKDSLLSGVGCSSDDNLLEEAAAAAQLPPPPVPPKNRSSDPETLSLSSVDEKPVEREEIMPTKHIILAGKKKGRPPPPPVVAAATATPPTPPKKPPLKPPTD